MSGNVTTLVWNASDQLSREDAAGLLELAPDLLGRWSTSLGFPQAIGDGQATHFRRDEIEALRATLSASHSVEGAVREARRRLGRES
jgi:hypothetical protein